LFRLYFHYGFQEQPNIPRVLKSSSRDFNIELADTTFSLSRETLISPIRSRMALWRLLLFIGIAHDRGSAAGYFRIPSERVRGLSSSGTEKLGKGRNS